MKKILFSLIVLISLTTQAQPKKYYGSYEYDSIYAALFLKPLDTTNGKIVVQWADGKFYKMNWPVFSGGGGTTTNALTFNNSGTGDASGSTFNGSAAKTLSYNSIGAQATLVSGTNIKTINSTSLLGSGDIAITTPTPAGNYGNIQINRNGQFSTAASDSLNWDATNNRLNVLGSIRATNTVFGSVGNFSSGIYTGDFAQMSEVTSITTPAAGRGNLYALNNGTIHYKNSAGTDYDLTLGAAVGANGTYTATLSNVTNISSSSAISDFTYSQVGNVVTFSGAVSVTASSNSATTTLEVTLPVASGFTSAGDLSGTANSDAVFGYVYANTTNGKAAISFKSPASGAVGSVRFICQYKVTPP